MEKNVMIFNNRIFYLLMVILSLVLPFFWMLQLVEFQFQFFIGSLFSIFFIIFKIPPLRTNPKLHVSNRNNKVLFLIFFSLSIFAGLILVIYGKVSLQNLNFSEIFIGFISTIVPQYLVHYGTYRIEISKEVSKEGIYLKISRMKLLYILSEEVYIGNKAKITFKESAFVIYHTIEIQEKEGSKTLYIAPGNHQGINLTSKILELLDPLPVFIERINSLKIPGIPLPRGNNIQSISLGNTQDFNFFKNTTSDAKFKYDKTQSKISIIVRIVALLFLILFIAVSAAIPVNNLIYYYSINDYEYFGWALGVLVAIGLILFILNMMMLSILGLFNKRKIYDTKYNVVIEYEIPIIENYKILISKRLNPEFVWLPKNFRRDYDLFSLKLANADNINYYLLPIGYMKN